MILSKIGVVFYLIAVNFSCFAQPDKHKEKSILDAGAFPFIQSQCNDSLKKIYSINKGEIIRDYNKLNYTLIDTSGLYIYTIRYKHPVIVTQPLIKVWGIHAFFSIGPCGDIYNLNDNELKKHFKKYNEFIDALKKNDGYIKVSTESNMTLINELYNKYVIKRKN